MPSTAKEIYDKTPIKVLVVSDSDGTFVEFVPKELKENAKLSDIEQEGLRELLINNPEVGVVILTGRQNGEANNLYAKLMQPEGEEGIRLKAFLCSENGANLQIGCINSNEENLNPDEHPENLFQITDSLSQEETNSVVNAIKRTVGEHYTEDSKSTDKSKWFSVEIKKFGFTVHYRKPEGESQAKKYNVIKQNLYNELEKLGNTIKLHLHDGGAAFALEKISKGISIEQLMSNKGPLIETLNAQGINVDPVFITYTGDETPDHPALEVVNENLNEKELDGYSARTCNYTTIDPVGRIPNDPKGIPDSFYIIGNKDETAQKLHLQIVSSKETLYRISNLRKKLKNKGLMPSQNPEKGLPPFVLLDTKGAILLQEPEKYESKHINSFNELEVPVAMLIKDGPKSKILKEVALNSKNIIAVTMEGMTINNGKEIDLTSHLNSVKNENKIISDDPNRATEIHELRVANQLLNISNLLLHINQEQDNIARETEPLTNVEHLGALAARAKHKGKIPLLELDSKSPKKSNEQKKSVKGPKR